MVEFDKEFYEKTDGKFKDCKIFFWNNLRILDDDDWVVKVNEECSQLSKYYNDPLVNGILDAILNYFIWLREKLEDDETISTDMEIKENYIKGGNKNANLN